VKRLLVFVVLLALGFVALRFAIGDEQALSLAGSGDAQRPPPVPPPTLEVDQGRHRAGVAVVGHFTHTFWRRVELPGGVVRHEPMLQLQAADSRPLASGVQQLDGVDAQLFDRGAPAATLRASQAFVTLQADANGKPSLDETKDVDLRDIVLESLPGSRLAGLRLELARAKVVITDSELLLTTPPDEPVLVVLDGERRVQLRGKGVQARLPNGSDGALRRADVEILREPVLAATGVEVRARGRLRYVEDVDAGTGQITLDDRVELDLTGDAVALPRRAQSGGASGGTDRTTVRGDQFVGWLSRARRAEPGARDTGGERERRDGRDEPLVWRQLLLTGSPAVVEAAGNRVRTPRLTIVPGLTGEPAFVSAHGGESTLEQTTVDPDGKREPITATTRRRMLLWRASGGVGALHRSLGFPRWTLGPIEQTSAIVVDGEARFATASRTIVAANGARIVQRDGVDAAVVRGLGATRVERAPRSRGRRGLVATGTDGFLWTPSPTGDVLQLGPAVPADLDAPGAWRSHEFDVRSGDARVQGRGVATIEQDGTDDGRVVFVSPDGTLDANVPEHGLLLQRVRKLTARLRDDQPEALDVAGWPVAVTLRRGTDEVQAEAPRLLQTGPRSLRLLPQHEDGTSLWSGLPLGRRLPVLRQRSVAAVVAAGTAQQVEVRGPAIDVHHAGGRDVAVDARAVGDELPHLYARIATDGGEPTTVACRAGRLRVLPFLLTREVRALHTAGRGGALSALAFRALGEGWLLLDDVREFELDDAEKGHVAGRATRLTVSRGARAAVFVGDADTLTPAEVVHARGDRTTTLHGARVVLADAGDSDVRIDAFGTWPERSPFVPPSLTLRTAGRTGLFSHMQASCRGTITVLPESVDFRGPVTVLGLRPDGSLDPRGLHVEAPQLQLVREQPSGDVVRIVGRDVVADWQQLHARAQSMTIDHATNRLVASDPGGALVRFANGTTFRSPRVVVDLATWAVRVSDATMVPAPPAEARK
jgi:hypothetical protein